MCQLAVTREAGVIVISSMEVGRPGSRIGQYARGSGEFDYAAELLFVGVADERPDEHGIIDVTWQCKKARNIAGQDIELRFDGARARRSRPPSRRSRSSTATRCRRQHWQPLPPKRH